MNDAILLENFSFIVELSPTEVIQHFQSILLKGCLTSFYKTSPVGQFNKDKEKWSFKFWLKQPFTSSSVHYVECQGSIHVNEEGQTVIDGKIIQFERVNTMFKIELIIGGFILLLTFLLVIPSVLFFLVLPTQFLIIGLLSFFILILIVVLMPAGAIFYNWKKAQNSISEHHIQLHNLMSKLSLM